MLPGWIVLGGRVHDTHLQQWMHKIISCTVHTSQRSDIPRAPAKSSHPPLSKVRGCTNQQPSTGITHILISENEKADSPVPESSKWSARRLTKEKKKSYLLTFPELSAPLDILAGINYLINSSSVPTVITNSKKRIAAFWPTQPWFKSILFGRHSFIYFGLIQPSLFLSLYLCQLCVSGGQALSILSNYPPLGLNHPQGKPVFFGQDTALGQNHCQQGEQFGWQGPYLQIGEPQLHLAVFFRQ